MIDFLKGIIVGIGGIAPGLSGSILLVIFGLYNKTIEAIGTLFKDIKKNLKFLVPLFLGFGVGVFLFSKIVDYFITNYEMYTRYTFLGLVLGTIPIFYKEVKKEGFSNKYYIFMVISFILGFSLFFFNNNLFPTVTNPNLVQSVILGIAVAGSTIIPGVDSAVILSSLGLYELYVSSIAELNFSVLIPAGFGLIIGALIISFFVNKLIKRYYTASFSVIFGLFLSIIPNILNESCTLSFNINSIISIILVILGFSISTVFGKLKDSKEPFKNIIKSLKKIKSIILKRVIN
mgnify:CR=1 FL=1